MLSEAPGSGYRRATRSGLPLIPFHNRISTVINEGAGIQVLNARTRRVAIRQRALYVIEEEDLFEATWVSIVRRVQRNGSVYVRIASAAVKRQSAVCESTEAKVGVDLLKDIVTVPINPVLILDRKDFVVVRGRSWVQPSVTTQQDPRGCVTAGRVPRAKLKSITDG